MHCLCLDKKQTARRIGIAGILLLQLRRKIKGAVVRLVVILDRHWHHGATDARDVLLVEKPRRLKLRRLKVPLGHIYQMVHLTARHPRRNPLHRP